MMVNRLTKGYLCLLNSVETDGNIRTSNKNQYLSFDTVLARELGVSPHENSALFGHPD